MTGAIHRAAGPEMLAECQKIAAFLQERHGLQGGYRLPASHAIHTVGPVWKVGATGSNKFWELLSLVH